MVRSPARMQPLHQAIPGALITLLRDAPLSAGKVQFAWDAAVGPAVRRATAIRLEGQHLIVEAASPQWAREVTRSAGVILSRLQALLGRETVLRLVVRARHDEPARRWRGETGRPGGA
jgi:hypothetical protein